MKKTVLWCLFFLLMISTSASAACTDSDGGKDYYVKGTTSTDSSWSEDRCLQYGQLTEIYCGDGGVMSSITFTCPNGCEDGACLPANCTSHDHQTCWLGDLYWRDSCDLLEEKIEDCVYGCENAACAQGPESDCSDTDGGLDYYAQGQVLYDGAVSYDTCTEGLLYEAYCTGNVNTPMGLKSYSCPNGCLDGACVEDQDACSEDAD